MKKNGLLLLIVLLATTFLIGQNSRQEIYYQKKFSESSTVFTGKVISKESYKGYSNNRIYTRNIIEITNSLKGNILKNDIVELTTQGGELENTIEIVGHGENIPINEEFLFMCSEFRVKHLGWESHLMLHGENSYTSVASNRKLSKYIEEYSVLSGERAMTNTIEFEFNNVAINGNRLKFDILAKTNLANAKFAGADLFIEYSENVFGSNIVSNEGININRALITQNNLYDLSLVDENISTAKLSIISDCSNGEELSDLSSDFQSLVKIDVTISNLTEIGEISLDAFAIEGNVFYWQNCATVDNAPNCCFPFDDVEVPTPITTRTPCTIVRADTLLTAGTGDILTIIGTGFDTLQGTVKFPNADDGGMTLMSAQPLDIFEWNDTTIQVRVPSLETAGDPAGSGNFFVANVSGDSCISPQPLEIVYAVDNFRNNGLAQWIYLGDALNTASYKFVVDTTIANNPMALKTVGDALCDWTQITGIDWELSGTSSLNTAVDNDTINLIYMADASEFVGTSAGSTASSIRRIQRCDGITALGEPDTTLAYYIDLDIKIREDVTQIGSAGWHFDDNTPPGLNSNLFDFYSVVLHELGHCHDLRHAIPDTKLMFWQLKPGDRQGIVSADSLGGTHALIESNAALPLAPTICAPAIGRNFSLCTTSVNSVENYHNINVFPNPILYNKINIDFELDKSNEVQFHLYDVSGKLITIVDKGYFGSGNYVEQLHISDLLPSGLYFLVVQIGPSISTFKIQKQR